MIETANRLFKIWNSKGIKYCHWKSNEHLCAGLAGDTDLDILIDRKDSNAAQACLLKCGFKRFEAVSYLKYVAIEDYIGFDEDTGNLLHIHLHFELVIGRKFLKQYHLPWENEILNSAIRSNFGVMTINPEFEIILLIIRFITKHSISSSMFNKRRIPFNKNERKEFCWLIKRLDKERLLKNARRLLGEETAREMTGLIENKKCNFKRSFSKTILKKLSYYKSDSSEFKLFFLHYYYKLSLIKNYIALMFLKHPVPYKRKMVEGGRIIAFLGADGSGKTTIIKNMSSWLSWKINVFPIYFGSGDGQTSILMMPLKLIVKVRQFFRGDVVKLEKLKNETSKKGRLYRLGKALWAILLIYDKKKKFQKMIRARNKGMVVICDRYPQVQYLSMNDGPLLSDWLSSSCWIKKKISGLEEEIYTQVSEYEPDIIFKLQVPIATALKRKKDTPSYIVEKKIEIVEKLKFRNNDRVIKIDTSDELQQTILNVKRHIWRNM